MFDWLIIAALLAALVFFMAPQQLPVSLYKLSLVALAAVAGYWIDRSVFPYARPHFFIQPTCIEVEQYVDKKELAKAGAIWSPALVGGSEPVLAAQCMLRRAIIMAAAMLAMGLGA
jgi:hypothetical protein